jgi:hypothetical protein
MSSTDARRYKRKRERDIRKGKIEEYLKIPTEKDVEDYVLNKSKELRMVETINPLNINLYEEVK